MPSTWIPDDWTFRSEAVAQRFDDHVRETLPWYDLATHGVAHLVRAFLPTDGLVYDIGASTGNLGRALADTLKARSAGLVALEQSEEMAARYDAPGECFVADARKWPYESFDVAVMFLTLMFIPIADRVELLDQLEQKVRAGGAIVVVDKAELVPGYLGSTIHRWTMSQKKLGGISDEEIAAKELSLSGTQRPIASGFLEKRGYRQWLQVGEFRGYVLAGAHV